MKTMPQVVLIALLALTIVSLSTEAQAMYRKEVIMVSGQEAPGTDGAVFSSVLKPKVICIAESGKVLFRAWLEQDGIGVTAENDMGLWVHESDSLRLIARRGSPVPGQPGMIFRKDTQLYLEGNMDRSGRVSLDAFYSPDGTAANEEHGFFMEENGEMVLKVYPGLEVATGANVLTFDAGAFNNERVVFYCLLEGPNVDNQSNRAYCMFGPEGVTVLARYREPMPLMSGGWVNQDVKQYNDTMPLSIDGTTVFQIAGYNPDIGSIGVAYQWSPDEGFEVLRASHVDSSITTAYRNWRMDTFGYRRSTPLNQWPYTLAVFDHDNNVVAMDGDSADGTGGATFGSWVSGFAAIDPAHVAFNATLSDYRRGIWIGDQYQVRKVVQKDDWVTGVTDSIQFGDVIMWMPNSKGQIAVANTMPQPPYFTYTAGIWMFYVDGGAEPITVRGESFDVAYGETRTIWGIYTGLESTTGMDEYPISSGADGFPAKLNGAGQLAFAASFYEGGNAVLIAFPGLIVNAIGDAPDLDPGDGVCNTGVSEFPDDCGCTLRAAIMEANAHPGRDTIFFNIKGASQIYPYEQLPHLTDEVLIDAASQPDEDWVVLAGDQCGYSPDEWLPAGLVIEASHCTIRGLKIGSFQGDGIYIVGPGGHNRIEGCQLGYRTSSEINGNLGHGIHIHNSSSNTIGGFGPLDPTPHEYFIPNDIRYNQGAGVFVHEDAHGISYYNSIRGNQINSNGGLGIDISPEGVTENDTLGGAALDAVTNFPVVDSVFVTEGGATDVFGSIYERTGRTFVVDLYLNMDCDSTLYGEGQFWGDSVIVQTDGEGKGEFLITLAEEVDFDDNFITMTATLDGYTSEFSLCWPGAKKIKVLDINEQPIANDLFSLAIVHNDPPTFTEEHIRTVNSDDDGIITLTEHFLDNTLKVGDSIQIKMELSGSGSKGLWPVKSPEVTLDNAIFDSITFDMSYDTLTADTLQEILLAHSTFKFDVRVSIEWDATREYIDSLQSAFRKIADYLYDVGDGQWTLGSVSISEDMGRALTGSDDDDIILLADNYYGSEYSRDNESRGFISRRFFRDRRSRPNLSAAENPMNPAADPHWRKLAQLLGNHLLALRSEYTGIYSGCPLGELGFMQWPYDGSKGPMDSEMSSSASYSDPDCLVTEQFMQTGLSCWETFVDGYQSEYRGVLAPLYMPEDGYLPPGVLHYAGPNDHRPDGSVNLQYDVGAQVTFPGLNDSSSAFDELWTFTSSEGTPLAGARVHTYRGQRDFNKRMDQGRTSSEGQLWLVGVDDGHVVNADNTYISVVTGSGEPYQVRRFEYGKWVIGDAARTRGTASASGPTVALEPVYGDFPLICWGRLTTGGFDLPILAERPFGSLPGFSYEADDGSEINGTFDLTAATFSTYEAFVEVDSRSLGWVTVSALDDSAAVFDFSLDYWIANAIEGQELVSITSADGSARFTLDGAANHIQQGVVVSSSFPIIRNGLSGLSLQVGKTHSLAFDQPMLNGENSVSIGYDETDFSDIAGGFNGAQSLQVFSWNTDTWMWNLVGGVVDTLLGVVNAPITEGGIYAAFTTDFATGVDDETGVTEGLPYRFELSQNYPNPFNPATTIRYSLPERAQVTIEVYNVLGQKVRTLVNREESAGSYAISWSGIDATGRAVATGVYFYRFQAGHHVETKKMLLLK